MSQKADGGFPHLGQDALEAPGKTSSEVNATGRPSSGNQSGVVCLPLVSDSQRLIWVSSNQINMQLDGAAKLDEAFDRFPYLTRKQTALLAQRCSLHPDQVKVWFIAQRLRYGISWDAEDIPNVRKMLTSRLGEEEVQNGEGTADGRRFPQEPSARDGRMLGENGAATERLEMEIRPAQPTEQGRRGGQWNKPMKRKRRSVTDEMGRRRVKHGGEGAGERAQAEETRSEGSREETTRFAKKKAAESNQRLGPVQRWPPCRMLDVPNDLLDASPHAFHQPPVTCVHRAPLKSETQADLDRDGRALPGRVRLKTKSRAQLAMMQAAFSQCQYPNVEDYSRLSEAIELPRYVLVQWFGDMRYYIKKFHPRWLSDEQYARALATIRDQQYTRSLVQSRGADAGGDRGAAWTAKFDAGVSCGEEEKTMPQPADLMPL
ncbi:homeobox and leucine zipper encoding b [Spinachia spinachia]